MIPPPRARPADYPGEDLLPPEHGGNRLGPPPEAVGIHIVSLRHGMEGVRHVRLVLRPDCVPA